MSAREIRTSIKIIKTIKSLSFSNKDISSNEAFGEISDYLKDISKEAINLRSSVFNISDKLFIYLFKSCDVFFSPKLNLHGWTQYEEKYRDNDKVDLDQFKDYGILELLRNSQTTTFTKEMVNIIMDMNDYYPDNPTSLEGFKADPEYFVNILEQFPSFINYISPIVYAKIKYYKKSFYDPYPDYQNTDLNRSWKKLFNMTLYNPLSESLINEGVRWLLYTKPDYKMMYIIIQGFDIEQIFNLDDFFKCVFDPEDTTYGWVTIDTCISKYNVDYSFVNTFKNYLLTHPNIISYKSFGLEHQQPIILRFINFENFIPTTPGVFTNHSFEVNEEVLKILADTQEGFGEALFKAINKIFTDFYNKPNRWFSSIRVRDASINALNDTLKDMFERQNIKIKINFDDYIAYKELLPVLKNYSQFISKESIIQFLERQEPTREVLQAWEEIWRLQHGNLDDIPPPPQWFILQYDTSNVHSKVTIKVTDCRLKLLRDNFPNFDDTIESIAQEIEDTTRQVAEINVKTEKNKYKQPLTDQEEKEYITNHTINKSKILDCRLSETEPRYYGFGEIYQQTQAAALPDDQRVDICNTLIRVWKVIQSTKDNKVTWNTLITQFVGIFDEHLNEGACNQGWVGSLASAFGSFAKDLGYLCMDENNEDEQSITEFKENLLVDMREYIPVSYPTISKLFTDISDILGNVKYDDSWEEDFKDDDKKLESFREKVQMYDILFEPTGEFTVKERKETMTKFINNMVPSFFIQAYMYFNENASENEKEDILKIKKAVLAAYKEFLEFQLKKIQ